MDRLCIFSVFTSWSNGINVATAQMSALVCCFLPMLFVTSLPILKNSFCNNGFSYNIQFIIGNALIHFREADKYINVMANN